MFPGSVQAGANDFAPSERRPELACCEFEGCRSTDWDHDMGWCRECDSWYCPLHGEEICAACIEKSGVEEWLAFLADDRASLVNELKYRVQDTWPVLGWVECTVRFLTSTAALAYAAEKPWRVAEEFDGKHWLRFSEHKTEAVAA